MKHKIKLLLVSLASFLPLLFSQNRRFRTWQSSPVVIEWLFLF